MRGKFIVFEGIDGSGKTTQLRNTEAKLEESGISFICDKEPTDEAIGQIVRSALKKERCLGEETLALLFAADRLEHIKSIIPILESGKTVLCDRYVFSSLAYQSAALPMKKILELNGSAIEEIMPDLTVFIDTAPEACMRRIDENRGAPELFESSERAHIVRENYLKAFDLFKNQTEFAFINGNDCENDVAERVWKAVKTLFKQ